MSEPRILIVDDSRFDRMVLRKALLGASGQAVRLTDAASAAAALEQLEIGGFDAVILDLNLPGEDGFSVLHEIRRRTASTWPLVFVYSASEHPDDVAQAYSGAANAYVQKPRDMTVVRQLAAGVLALIETAPGRPRLH